jgi:hypothetical protein
MSDLLRKYKSLYSSTTNTFSTGEGVTITPASVVGLPTDTEITLTFDRVDSSGTKTPSKMERIRGTVVGSNFVVSSGGRAVEGTEQVHTSPVVEMIWNADDWNDTVDHILTEHNQDGTHKAATVTTLKATGAEINTGTEDAKIVTPKALADSNLARTTDKLSSFAATTSAELAGVVSDETGSGSLVFGTAPTLNSPVLQGNVDGWIADTDTWVYVSASTFKIEGKNVTTKFPKGTRLKFTQTTAKYAVVTASSFSTDTTVTIAVNTNYTIDNADITSPNYSYQENPQGYPDWFSFTPSIAGSNFGNTATITGKYRLDGRTCYFRIGVVLGGTGISIGSTILTLPITINSTAYGNYSIIGHGSAFNGTNTYPIHITGNGQMFFYNNTGATDIVYGNNFSSSTPFTWKSPHTLYQQGFYEIA